MRRFRLFLLENVSCASGWMDPPAFGSVRLIAVPACEIQSQVRLTSGVGELQRAFTGAQALSGVGQFTGVCGQ